MCHLQRIHLHFWRVDAVMQGAYHRWRYPRITKLCSTQQHFLIALMFLLVLMCCYSPGKAGQRKWRLIHKCHFKHTCWLAFWFIWYFCVIISPIWGGSRNLCLATAPWFLCGHLSPYSCSYCICMCVIVIIYKVQNHVHSGCSKCTHTHTHTHTYTHTHTHICTHTQEHTDYTWPCSHVCLWPFQFHWLHWGLWRNVKRSSGDTSSSHSQQQHQQQQQQSWWVFSVYLFC